MVNKRNTLGRGLGSLLNTKDDSNNDKLFDEIDINHININSDQPRKTFDENKLKFQCFKNILDFDDSNTKMKPWTCPAY